MVPRPVALISSPTPLPGPVPNTLPRLPASEPPSSSRGPKTLSASGPASRSAIGARACEIMRRSEKTLPWTAGATLVCQSTLLAACTMGTSSMRVNALTTMSGTEARSPAETIAMPPRKRPNITPLTSCLGPPQMLTIKPPATAPAPAADRTPPAVASDAKDTISGM